MEPWLGICRLQKTDGTGENYTAIAAVFCRDGKTYDKTLKTVLAPQGYRLICSEEVLPAGKWIARRPKEGSAAKLARVVHAGHTVEIGMPKPQYLTITEHEIPALPDQSRIPFWDQEWIEPELKELLFGQLEDGAKPGTYFIVDATLRKNITGIFDLDGGMIDVPIQCLFKGDAAENLKEAAPYLIDMTLPEGAWDDRTLVPRFHKDFFKNHWENDTGIFIRSSDSFEKIMEHCRKFTKYTDESGKGYFFRYYGEKWLQTYLAGRRDDINVLWNWFRKRAHISSYILSAKNNVTVLGLSDSTPEPNIIVGGFQIDDYDRTHFRVHKYQIEADKFSTSLKNEFSAELSSASLEDLSETVSRSFMRMSAYGFDRWNDLKVLATWEAFYGPSFEDKDPDSLLKRICVSSLPSKDKFRMFAKRMKEIELQFKGE